MFASTEKIVFVPVQKIQQCRQKNQECRHEDQQSRQENLQMLRRIFRYRSQDHIILNITPPDLKISRQSQTADPLAESAGNNFVVLPTTRFLSNIF